MESAAEAKILQLLDVIAVEVAANRVEIAANRNETSGLRNETSELRNEVRSGFDRVERRLGNLENRVENLETEVECVKSDLRSFRVSSSAASHRSSARRETAWPVHVNEPAAAGASTTSWPRKPN